MSKRIRPRVPAIIAAAAALGCAASVCEAAVPSFVQGGALRVCLDPSFPPMEFYANPNDAQPVGVDVDLSQALARQWGVPLRLMPVEFSGMLPALQAGRCDLVVSAVLLKPQRAAVLHALPYLSTYVVILARADSNLRVASELDLAGKTIATESGTDYARLLELMNTKIVAAGRAPITIQTYPKDSDAIQQLLVGRAAGVVSQDTEVAHRNAQDQVKFKVLYRFPVPDRYAIYMRPNPADEASVAAAIARVRADGQLKAIIEHWRLPPETLDSGTH